ncbi:hypothetical protein MAR_030924 [Mya arenaria]|uniref:Uncharacterized protein n=1 Tax=Mya arenaria TaxID=6604 RepID=A0ABY7F3J5_MYAAR|nr:hypothetical protein MAR_030924 [Mya arenaria]
MTLKQKGGKREESRKTTSELDCTKLKVLKSKKLTPKDFTYDEVRQLLILPWNAMSFEDYRNLQLWMPPISAIENMSKNVQCLIDYYFTAGGHSKQMTNFLLSGSLVQTDTGVTKFDLGPDTHVNSIGECGVTDPIEKVAKGDRMKHHRKDVGKNSDHRHL